MVAGNKTHIEIVGAAEHNLRNISLDLPHHSLIVITGVSGSGKSSLAFDTIYKEGQRRFIESLSAYARQFLGGMEKPKVEHIEGICPTVCIDQKRRGHSSRSTVGTITSILDYLRLLFARLGEPYCPDCQVKVTSQSPDQISQIVLHRYLGQNISVLAPVVVARKGEYRKDFAEWRADGFLRARVNGKIRRLDEKIQLDRYEKHTIELVIDRLKLENKDRPRLREDIMHATQLGNGTVVVAVEKHDEPFSVHRACPHCGFSVPELEPRLFSFNNPQGACSGCHGRGVREKFDIKLIVPDNKLSITEGAITCFNKDERVLFSHYGKPEIEKIIGKAAMKKPWKKLTSAQKKQILYGGKKVKFTFPGIIPIMERLYRKWNLAPLRRFLQISPCLDCNGARLRRESLHVLFRGHNISELSRMRLEQLYYFLKDVRLDEREKCIGREIFQELLSRLNFLTELGLSYLTVERRANTLAGGEMQRIRLARQLGAGLQGVLYVLDEPSIGLHARDNTRLLNALRQLRNMGNTVIVIEHDEETIQAADHIVDIGPGAGSEGGRLVVQGSPSRIKRCSSSLTGQYLTEKRTIPLPEKRRKANGANLKIVGAAEHNLKNIDVVIPLGLFVAVTGVSGSGKSTLIDDILYKALARHFYKNSEMPGKHREIIGCAKIKKVIEVDQSPIGRNPRSNPATYIKVFDAIRDLFATLPESKARGYSPGRFSFNAAKAAGRCSHCEGRGYKEVEMQFLPSVWVPCEECEGQRFNRETLEIRYKSKNISDILEMTVTEAHEFFTNHPRIAPALELLLKVGMSYIKLGQPSPSLSGGESQRIKLVRELKRSSGGDTLYILDEPTTGLHLDDIKILLKALNQLVERGDTVLVIEHHLDVIKTADWVIDLGPEGGEDGGTVIATGPPEKIIKNEKSHTGQALKRHLDRSYQVSTRGKRRSRNVCRDIVMRGATKHNLKNVDVTIPWQKMTVVTGVSGSGKSSLVLDTLFAEGQRTFLESMSTYARRFLGRLDHGEIDSLEGLAPAISIDQKSASSNPRSTVATMTEIYDYLRILYARIGIAHCPHCNRELHRYTPSSAAAAAVKKCKGLTGMVLAPLYLPGTGKSLALHSPSQLKKYAEYLRSEGYSRVCIEGKVYRLEKLPATLKRRPIHLVIDRIVAEPKNKTRMAEAMETAFDKGRGIAFFYPPGKSPMDFCIIPACVPCNHYQEQELQPRMFSFNHYLGACPECDGLGFYRGTQDICIKCKGERLKAKYLAVTLGGLSINDYCHLNVTQARQFIQELKLSKNEIKIAEDAIRDLLHRLDFLENVGLDYLTLERRGSTLSGGEAQRIRLATQIGNRLVGVIYVLDEPTIGLHQRDTARLLDTLRNLVELGNTVVMVEHDRQCIGNADHIIDMGPGAGHLGGEVIMADHPKNAGKYEKSLTGRYLTGNMKISTKISRPAPKNFLKVQNAFLHNLKNINIDFALNRLTVITGVSGSGKSTLLIDILQKSLARYFSDRKREKKTILGNSKTGFTKISGLEQLQRVIVVDQTPLSRSPSSNLATYCDFFGAIRQFYATLPGSRTRGFAPGHFSFNRPGGRCEICEGRGVIEIAMHFLSDVSIPCDACRGNRYLEETLSVHYKGKNIAQILEMDVAEAATFFEAHRKINSRLQLLKEIGLGYMKLGQPTTTLSGGEAQRLKLAKELSSRNSDGSLYIMDEPTTGLHAADVQKLLEVLQKLVDKGNSVFIIEHNLDIIKNADWIIDLGPEGGDKGGELICAGSLKKIMACTHSHTAKTLMIS